MEIFSDCGHANLFGTHHIYTFLDKEKEDFQALPKKQ